MTTQIESGEITIDLKEGTLECPATYALDVSWGSRNRRGYRELREVSCTIVSCTMGGLILCRPQLVLALGEEELSRQEDLFVENWSESAAEDEAAEYGDWKRDQRADA